MAVARSPLPVDSGYAWVIVTGKLLFNIYKQEDRGTWTTKIAKI